MRQFGHLQGSYKDARSRKHKKVQVSLIGINEWENVFILMVILMYIYQITRSTFAEDCNTQLYVCLRNFRLQPRSSWELGLRSNHCSSRNKPDERSSLYVYCTIATLVQCTTILSNNAANKVHIQVLQKQLLFNLRHMFRHSRSTSEIPFNKYTWSSN